jgi:transposase InsO family protein
MSVAPCVACDAMQTTREKLAMTAFDRLFAERGLPLAIRSDTGVPFAGPKGLLNLSKLSVWWLRLGIQIGHIKPGHPQQNGRRERMHLTLKKEATHPPAVNTLQQQEKFDHFVDEFQSRMTSRCLGYEASRRSRWRLSVRRPNLIDPRPIVEPTATGTGIHGKFSRPRARTPPTKSSTGNRLGGAKRPQEYRETCEASSVIAGRA